MIHLDSHSEDQTHQLSYSLGVLIENPCCIALQGNLGAGKTCFVQGLAAGMGIEDDVVSPTFSIIHELNGKIDLLHSDLYRLEEHDLPNLGLEEMFEDFDGVVIIEWADKFPELLPQDTLFVNIDIQDQARKFLVYGTGPVSKQLCEKWHSAVEK